MLAVDRIERGDAGALGQAISFGDRDAAGLLEALQEIGRQGRCAAYRETEGRQVERFAGIFQQRGEKRGHRAEAGYAMMLDDLPETREEAGRAKPLRRAEKNRCPLQERDQPGDHHRVHMEQGQAAEEEGFLGQCGADHPRSHPAVGDDLGMGAYRDLGEPRGAAGAEIGGGIAGRDIAPGDQVVSRHRAERAGEIVDGHARPRRNRQDGRRRRAFPLVHQDQVLDRGRPGQDRPHFVEQVGTGAERDQHPGLRGREQRRERLRFEHRIERHHDARRFRAP